MPAKNLIARLRAEAAERQAQRRAAEQRRRWDRRTLRQRGAAAARRWLEWEEAPAQPTLEQFDALERYVRSRPPAAGAETEPARAQRREMHLDGVTVVCCDLVPGDDFCRAVPGILLPERIAAFWTALLGEEAFLAEYEDFVEAFAKTALAIWLEEIKPLLGEEGTPS